jgi:hypothetical protein
MLVLKKVICFKRNINQLLLSISGHINTIPDDYKKFFILSFDNIYKISIIEDKSKKLPPIFITDLKLGIEKEGLKLIELILPVEEINRDEYFLYEYYPIGKYKNMVVNNDDVGDDI